MSLLQLASILRARWRAAGLILLLTLAAAMAFVLLRPASYTARAPVLVDVQANDVGGGYSPALITSYLATQMDVARSERVALRAADLLRGQDRTGARPPPLSAAEQAARAEQARRLQKTLTVRPARESNIIHIDWRGRDAEEAARVANAFARAFVDVALEIKTNPAKSDSAWFDEQVRDARQQLEQAQMKLADRQRRAGIVSENDADFEVARLNQLANQLALVQAQTTDSQSKLGVGGDSVAEAMQSPLVNGLKADIARAESRLQEAGATLGPQHPQMVRLQAELQALNARLGAETRRINSSIQTSFASGKARERELSAALAAQRERVLAINQERAQLALLRQDVQAAQRAFEAVSTNASKTRLASLAGSTNLSLLAPADAPPDPDGASARQVLAIAALAGLVLAAAGALMMELANRRVRSADDISAVLDLPVLATVPAATAGMLALPSARRRLGYSGGGAT